MRTEDELLREFQARLSREMAPLRTPSTLFRELRRRRNRRRGILLSACAVLLLGVGSIPVAASLEGGSASRSRATSMQSTSFVVARASRALSSVSSNTIIYVHSASLGDTWTYQGSSRHVSGSPATEIGVTPQANGMTVTTEVDYGSQTWWTRTAPTNETGITIAPQHPSCSLSLDLSNFTSPDAFRQILTNDGFAAVADGSVVDGVSTTELVRTCGGSPQAAVYLSTQSGLPVRVVLEPGESLPGGPLQLDYSYLLPTPANLTLLQVKAPPGFTEVAAPPS